MRVCLNGKTGKVGRVLGPALEREGHTLVELDEAEAVVDFTAPEAALPNVLAAVERGVPAIVGTTGWDVDAVDAEGRIGIFRQRRRERPFILPVVHPHA